MHQQVNGHHFRKISWFIVKSRHIFFLADANFFISEGPSFLLGCFFLMAAVFFRFSHQIENFEADESVSLVLNQAAKFFFDRLVKKTEPENRWNLSDEMPK